jgi:molybdopterin-guanine dinucleotide biosynthesis protein
MYPDSVCRYPLAKRSGHASHSSAAIGVKAEYLTENHDPVNAVGYDSPIYKMVRSGGKILLIGVTHTTNTTIHLAESLAAPYCRLPYNKSWGYYLHTKLPDGTIVRHKQAEFNGCSENFDIIEVIEEHLAGKNLIAYGKIGDADSRLIDAGGMIEAVTAMIKAQPDILLCENPDCPSCPPRRMLVESKNIRELALNIAKKAHKGQVDKAGEDYIHHPLAVAENFVNMNQNQNGNQNENDDFYYITAVLHDVVEDTDMTFDDLRAYGFSEEVIAAVDAITKRKGEKYDDYLDRVKSNTIARTVKIADLTHNSQLSRLKEVTQKDYERLEKYKKALEFLSF